MKSRTYFLVNDTRYDNHHGGLTVVRNLHAGMQARGWTCTGSLPVSASPSHLHRYRQAIGTAELIVVNGEGSLHHDSRNARRLLAIAEVLQKSHPVCLVNAVWQDNADVRWKPVLERFACAYARDRRSQRQLQALGRKAGYAPDLTFYDYPRFPVRPAGTFICTDSVLNAWTSAALRLCEQDEGIRFQTLFTGEMTYMRGIKDWNKRLKYCIYPWLWTRFGIKVPPRYQSLPYAQRDTRMFLETLAASRAVCVGRYHALCFALQQQIPFVVASSNSHKSESLLEEVGLPLDACLIDRDHLGQLRDRLERAARDYPTVAEQIAEFNRAATGRIHNMLDHITGPL
jgi:hypothetical protein